MDLAVKENDYLAQSFLQWFIDEQLEEVVKMDRLLERDQPVRREEPADGRGLPGAHRKGRLTRHEPCVKLSSSSSVGEISSWPSASSTSSSTP